MKWNEIIEQFGSAENILVIKYLIELTFWRRGGGIGNVRGGVDRGRGSGGSNSYDYWPPARVTEMGYCLHPCENDLIVKCTNDRVPYFNAPIFLESKSQIGTEDEILIK